MTSISDRCKTAREGATPGPWEATDHDIMRSGWRQRTYDAAPYLYDDVSEVEPHDADDDQVLKCLDPHWREMYRQPGDLVLAALAPEAADEVVRLTNAIECIAYRLAAQARAVDTDKDGKLFALAFETYTELFELLERRHQ